MVGWGDGGMGRWWDGMILVWGGGGVGSSWDGAMVGWDRLEHDAAKEDDDEGEAVGHSEESLAQPLMGTRL